MIIIIFFHPLITIITPTLSIFSVSVWQGDMCPSLRISPGVMFCRKHPHFQHPVVTYTALLLSWWIWGESKCCFLTNMYNNQLKLPLLLDIVVITMHFWFLLPRKYVLLSESINHWFLNFKLVLFLLGRKNKLLLCMLQMFRQISFCSQLAHVCYLIVKWWYDGTELSQTL